MSRLRTALTLLVTVVYSLFGALGLSDLVLCYSSDGHVAIESTHQECCHELEHQLSSVSVEQRAVQPDHSSPSTRCGDCVDVPLAISHHDQEPPERASVGPAAHMMIEAISLAPRASISAGLIRGTPVDDWTRPPHLASLRGVLMRC